MTENDETDREQSALTRRQLAKLALGLGTAGGATAVLWNSVDTKSGTTTETATESPATSDSAGTDGDSGRSPEPTTRADAAGIPIVVPGDLPRVLADATPHTLVRCAQDVFEPSETLDVPPQVELDARGATIRPQHGGAAVQFADGATMRGGTIDLSGRDATGLQVHAGEDGRFNSPVGPRGVTVRATPGSGAVGLRMAINPGKAMIAHQPAWIQCDGVSRPLVMRAKGPFQGNNFITSNDVYVEATNFETGVSLIGENTLRHNRIVCDLTPGPATETGTGILVNNPTAKGNWIEGTVHEPDRLNHVMVVKQCDQPGENVFGSWLGRSFGSPPEFVDRSEADDNRIVDFSGRPTSRNRLGRSPRPRNSSTAPTGETITPSVPIGDTTDPDGRSVVAKPGGLQAALNEAAMGNGPNVVRAKSGVTFEPNDVRVPTGVSFDARPATFRATPGTHTLFRFASGSRMIGGHVQTSGGYSGSHFVIAANGELIEDGAGPLGTTVEGSSNGDTALLVDARDGGAVENCRAYVHAYDTQYGLDVVADRGSRIENNTFRIKDTYARVGVRMRGNGVIADNNSLVQIQPDNGEAETGWLVTNPRARNNWVQGWFWDGQHFEDQHVVTIRGGKGNVYPNFLGQDDDSSPRFFKFVDWTGGTENYPISMAGIEDGRRAKEPFPADRLIAPLFGFNSLDGGSEGTLALDAR